MDLALFDMDGTLTDDSARKPLYEAQDWAAYWDKETMLAEPAWPEAQNMVESLLGDGWQVGVLTARLDELNRATTEQWLTEHDFHVTPIIMRDPTHTDLRPPEFKLTLLKEVIGWAMYERVVLYDNDQEVVDLITKELGAEYVVKVPWEPRKGEPA